MSDTRPSGGAASARTLHRLAGAVSRRSASVLALAAAIFGLAGWYGSSVSERLDPFGFEDPSEERVRAAERIERATGVDPEPAVVVLVRGQPVRSQEMRARVRRVERLLEQSPAVARAVTAFERRDAALVSRDRRATIVIAFMRAAAEGEQKEAAERVGDRLADVPGVLVGGEAAANAQIEDIIEEDLRRAELVAFPIVLALSFWFFRSLVAALIPPLLGAFAIAVTLALLRLLASSLSLSVFALNLAVGLGLGLAIDYSLLIVSRYREELARCGPGRRALERTLASAGRTVLFSALTVAAALASLLVFPQRFLYSMGAAGVIVPLVAAAGALVVLPAALALLGPRVDALAPRALQRRRERETRATAEGGWYRLSRLIMRRPLLIAVAASAVLLALASPFLEARFKQFDARVLLSSTEARQVFDALQERFPTAPAAPIIVVAGTGLERRAEHLGDRIADLSGVTGVSSERVAAHLTALTVTTRFDPLCERARNLVGRIRRIDPAGFDVLVGGETAAQIDQRQSLMRHLWIAVPIAIAATLLLLVLVTRSALLPLKQIAMNALVVAAAFGFLVLVFQQGRLEGVLGFESHGALELSLPVLIFALVFGLATDYGVFLFARTREARSAGASNEEAVATGLERTGRIVTAASLLFAVAIGALAASRIGFVKQLGLGTAFAVLIDASIVRALLVPSLMRLLGPLNWWPGRLRKPGA